MRKSSFLLAALFAVATPAVAQQAQTPDVPAAPAAPAEARPAEQQPAPSLKVTDEEIRQGLREQDRRQGGEEAAESRRQVPSNFLWLVAAVALGVIVASVIL